jgi:MFS family permease
LTDVITAEQKKAVSRMTWGVFVLMFMISMNSTLLGPLLTDIINEYRLQDWMQGALSAAQSADSVAALGLGLLLAGKIQKPVILLVSIGMAALSMLGAGLRPELVVLVGLYLAYGLAKGLTDSLASASIADMHKGRKQASRMGILHGAYGEGGLLAPVLIVQLKNAGTAWNNVYLVFAGITLTVFLVFFWVFASTRRGIRPYFEKTQWLSLAAIGRFFRFRRNLLLLGSILGFSFYQIGYFLWIGHYVETTLGDAAMGAVALSLFWIGTALSRILVPSLNISPVKAIVWSNVIAALSALTGIWSMSIPVIIVCSLIAGFANGATNSLLLYIGCSWFKEHTTLVSTMIFLAMYAGQIISPLAVGAVSAGTTLGWG